MRLSITLLTCLTVVSAAPWRWLWEAQSKDDVYYDAVASAISNRGGEPVVRHEGYDYDNIYTVGDVVVLPELKPTPAPAPVHVQVEPTPVPEPAGPPQGWKYSWPQYNDET